MEMDHAGLVSSPGLCCGPASNPFNAGSLSLAARFQVSLARFPVYGSGDVGALGLSLALRWARSIPLQYASIVETGTIMRNSMRLTNSLSIRLSSCVDTPPMRA